MKTKMKAFGNVLMGITSIGGASYMYNDILLWEQEGGTRRMARIFHILYEIAGANAAFLLFIPAGLYFFYRA